MQEIIIAIVEILMELTDHIFMEIRAKRILSQLPNHETAVMFVPFEAATFLTLRAARLEKITQMEHYGWIYLRSDRFGPSKSTNNFMDGETMYFLRSLENTQERITGRG